MGFAANNIGFWNAERVLNENDFYAMSFVLGLFAAVAAYKNTRNNLQNAVAQPVVHQA